VLLAQIGVTALAHVPQGRSRLLRRRNASVPPPDRRKLLVLHQNEMIVADLVASAHLMLIDPLAGYGVNQLLA
jgi:hypothetical protein